MKRNWIVFSCSQEQIRALPQHLPPGESPVLLLARPGEAGWAPGFGSELGYFSPRSSRRAGLGICSLPSAPLGAMCWLLLGVTQQLCGTSTFSCQPLSVSGPGPQLQLPPPPLPGTVSAAAAPSHSSFSGPASSGGVGAQESCVQRDPLTLVLGGLTQGKERGECRGNDGHFSGSLQRQRLKKEPAWAWS